MTVPESLMLHCVPRDSILYAKNCSTSAHLASQQQTNELILLDLIFFKRENTMTDCAHSFYTYSVENREELLLANFYIQN